MILNALNLGEVSMSMKTWPLPKCLTSLSYSRLLDPHCLHAGN